MALSTIEKAEIIHQHQTSSNDVGSAEVQVALLTHNIKHLTQHLQTHKKDKHSQRGLLAMVNKRRKLLAFLKKNELKSYLALIAKLGLRH